MNIIVRIDNEEAQEFVDYLNKIGHTAEIGDANYIDRVWVDTDEAANRIMNQLWGDYCGSTD